MDELYIPNKVMPTERKWDGGSQFDDEMESTVAKQAAIQKDYDTLVDHLRKRPDHKVYVGGASERTKMRVVFNHMFNTGVIDYHPDIRIEYGVADGAIRVAE